jgi:hypothetical protein
MVTIRHDASMGAERWWVFTRPLLSDRLCVVGLRLSGAAIVTVIVQSSGKGSGAKVLNLLFAVPSGILLVGIVGGSVREYRRGRGGHL